MIIEFKAYKKYGSYVRWRRAAYYRDKIEKKKLRDKIELYNKKPESLSVEPEFISSQSSMMTNNNCQYIEKTNHGKLDLPQYKPAEGVNFLILKNFLNFF